MCKDCGCGQANERHHHDHEHDHHGALDHDHGPHEHEHHPHGAVKTVSLESNILAHNDAHAAENRHWLKERGVLAVNLISSPGSGKTSLLETTLERLRGRIGCAVIVGDVRTNHDALRMQGKGAAVHQIETGASCHLDAVQVGEALPKVVTKGVRLLFIENVGNLVCPSAFDLGETFKIALLSVTEGEDKPVKYPALFSQSPVVVLTKTDLIPHLTWDRKACRDYLNQVRPGVFVFELSARTGEGMDAWIRYLESQVG